MDRQMQARHLPPWSNFALAWGLEQLVVRQLEWSLSVRPMGRFRWWRPTVRCILRCPAFTEMSHLKRRSNVCTMCGVSSRPFSSGGYQRGADDQSSNTLPAALRAGYMLRAIALVLEGAQDAATNSMVRQQVDTFQDQRGYPLNETTWHLAQGVQCRSVHQTQSVACLDHVTCCRLRLNFSALPWRLLYIDGFYASGIWHNRLGGYLTCSCI